MLKRTRPAERVLTNVEYLCLKMQAHPGESGRFYRRALNGYHAPGSTYSENFNTYFLHEPKSSWHTRKHYQVGRYYTDLAPRTKPFRGYGTATHSRVPVKGQWHLTEAGWNKANQARAKLGLAPVPYPHTITVNDN